jgi:type II secretory pathway pseudopilin PulG
LIELLVVIATIALLMAVLLPALSRARKQAKAVVCQSRLKQWATILASYAQDNDGRFPCNDSGSAGAWLLRGTVLQIVSADPNGTQDSLFHFRTEKIACCPLATRGSDEEGSIPIPGYVLSSFKASIDQGPLYVVTGNEVGGYPAWVMCKPAPRFVGSYGLNHFLFRPGFHSTLTFVPQSESRHGVNVFSLKNQGNIPLLLDSSWPDGGPRSADQPPPGLSDPTDFCAFCLRRHDSFTNGVFLDWSVRKIGLKELWTLKWNREFDTAGPWTKAGGVQREDWPRWMRGMKDY